MTLLGNLFEDLVSEPCKGLMKQYFDILKLPPGASWKEIKRAYKSEVKRWHPDRFPAEDSKAQRKAHARFQKIGEAYRFLENIYGNGSRTRFSDEQPFETTQKPFSPEDPNTDKEPYSSTEESKEAHGFFTRSWPNGDLYEGQISNGMPHGMGIYTSANGDKYTGQFKYGKADGQGKMVFTNGDSYSGEFREDAMNGQGTYNYANGDRYTGQLQNDLPHGEGVHIVAGGQVYAGQWEYGQLLA